MDFLEEEFEEILNIFREESEEQIQKINQNLLKLEANPRDAGVITELFREAHSIKGAARMIGLTDIQSLAHKIEDIFGLARDGNLQINAQIVDVLCKAADCISSIVEESIQTKGAFHSDETDKIINQLKDIEEYAKSHEPQDNDVSQNMFEMEAEHSQFSPEELTEIRKIFYRETVDLLPQILIAITKLKDSSVNTEAISDLYQLVENIYHSSVLINIYNMQEAIQDLKMKLDGVITGSGILIPAEVDEMAETIENFIISFDEMAENLNLKTLNVIENDDNGDQEIIPNKESVETENDTANPATLNDCDSTSDNQTVLSDFDYISNNLMRLADNSIDANNIIINIITRLSAIINSTENQEVKKIFERTLEIINFSSESGIKPNLEVAEVIKQSFDTASQMVHFSLDQIEEDPNLIAQRLAILQQMLKLSDQQPAESMEIKTEEVSDQSSKVDFSPAIQNTDIFPKADPIDKIAEISKSSDNSTIKTLRVDTKKLDQLVNQVGELIIAKIKAKEHLSEIEKIIRSIEDWYREWNKTKQVLKYMDKKPIRSSDLPSGTSIYSQNKSIYTIFEESSSRLSQFMNQMNDLYRTIQEDDARLNLIVNELEERIKSVRVLPLATIFHMFPRMVRDIARDTKKDVELIVSGSETSADKKIIEEIKAPLIHLIRNAVDHGIEPPDVRIKNGKNPTGKIFLSAYHLENSVLIEIIDDGRGINIEAIKRKVVEKGLLTQAELQVMNDNQIMNIIFWPGFSTGEVVTDISGRGIGLDVVHTKITQLNGKVSIKSTLGEGCKVSIQLPVTMATIKSFLVSANNQTFAIPTSAIKTAILIKSEEIFYKEGKETIIVENKTVPVCRLSRILEMPEEKVNEGKIIVIIIQAEDVQVGFIVDKLLGDQEILHKNLTPPLLRVRNVAGVTTLGSGELCLILNVSDLIKSAYSSFGIGQRELIVNKESNKVINRKNILVVDDSVTTRILERNILKAAGYNVTVAINGLDALTKIGTDNFDLIVSDVEMPEINGFELTERIRQDDKFKTIPVILVTSLASEVDRKKGINLGANAYITKGSFDQEELLTTIKRLIG